MKKSLAMMAVTGLLTASLAYVAPAMAKESNEMPMEPTLADNSGTASGMQQSPETSTDANTPSSGSETQNDMNNNNVGSSSTTPNSSGSSNSSSSSDEGSPDTATGDDDY